MPRAARIVIPGSPHHIIQRGFDRTQVFFDIGDYHAYLEQLRRFSSQYRFRILAWCLLPNHLHLLAVPGDAATLAKGIGSANLVYSQHYQAKYHHHGRLWHNRFYSCMVANDEHLWQACRFIECHPRRTGQVRRPEQWPWSSARAHLTGRQDPLVGKDWLPTDQREAWADYLNEESAVADAELLRATGAGQPFAADPLLAELERQFGRRLRPGKPGRPRKQVQES